MTLGPRWRRDADGAAGREPAHDCDRACRARRRGDIEGRYRSAELDASLEIVIDRRRASTAGSRACSEAARCSRSIRSAADVWLLPCQRSMDAPAPGDWTIRVRRDAAGAVRGLTVGCWLARRVEYAAES